MIKEFKVQNLNRKYNFDFHFHDDLNIFTGKNGSGKTTLLKTMWYVLSGNRKSILSELHFDSVYMKTTDKNIEFKLNKNSSKTKLLFNFSEKTLFFPTFRRIEGGFLTENNDSDIEFQRWHLSSSYSISSRLTNRHLSSNNKHQFIASISTDDIIDLLTKKYAEISERILKIEKQQSDFILESIAQSLGDEKGILVNIRNRQQETNVEKETLLRPFTILSELIKEIFEDKGIKITENLLFGDATKAVLSDKLSAGEKQMLSFLCYCMFVQDSVIFIDEPELSLHPDWQRLLMPTLLEIAPTNQFFIATHSPFIYAKYPDKEIILDQDKGGT